MAAVTPKNNAFGAKSNMFSALAPIMLSGKSSNGAKNTNDNAKVMYAKRFFVNVIIFSFAFQLREVKNLYNFCNLFPYLHVPEL